MKFKSLNKHRLTVSKIIFELLFIFHLSKCEDIICNITHPILIDNMCKFTYCTNTQFESSICIINNNIIKTQWLTSIIPISDINYRYINPFLTNNKDLIIQTTYSYGSSRRQYFGITKEGRFFFKNSEEKEYPYYLIDIDNDEQFSKYEGIGGSIQIENGDDFFLSIGIYSAYAEIIDYKKNTLSRKFSENFYNNYIISEIGSMFLMAKLPNNNDPKNYYVISFITYYDDSFYFMCKVYYFNSTDITNGYEIVGSKGISCANRKMSSCFQSIKNYYIFCFYQNIDYVLKVVIFKPNLNLDIQLIADIDSCESDE